MPSSGFRPASPCVKICRYSRDFFDGQVCIGCFREQYEVRQWAAMSAGEKAFTLLDAAERCPAHAEEIFPGGVSAAELERQAQQWRLHDD